jgi:hypothetical protein
MRPDVTRGPSHEGSDLGDLELPVPFDNHRVSSFLRLLASNCRDPGIDPRELRAERNDLSQLAAVVRRAFPQRVTVGPCLLVHGLDWLNASNRKSVSVFKLFPQCPGFRKKQSRVKSEDVDWEIVTSDQVDHHTPLGSESGGEGQTLGVSSGGPFQRLESGSILQLESEPLQVVTPPPDNIGRGCLSHRI